MIGLHSHAPARVLRLEDEPDYSPDDEDDEPPYGEDDDGGDDDDEDDDDDEEEEEEVWQVQNRPFARLRASCRPCLTSGIELPRLAPI